MSGSPPVIFHIALCFKCITYPELSNKLRTSSTVNLFLTDQLTKLSQPLGESAEANPLHVRLHIDSLMNTDG